MTTLAVLKLLVQFAPEEEEIIAEVCKWVAGGQKTVTDADIQSLIALGRKSAADYLAEAGGAPETKP